MLDRRSGCSPWLAALLAGALCVSVWQLMGCPGPPRPPLFLAAPYYTVLSPANASTDSPYSLHQLASNDAATLMDLRHFRFRVLNAPCNDSQPLLLLVLVHSAPGNVVKRKTIRETWGEARDGVKLLFLLGAVDVAAAQSRLEEENHQHGDLIQGNFKDAYRNMTYKHVMALKYAVYHCSQAKYILKTDDDVFVNMPTLVSFLNVELSPWGARRLLLCCPVFKSFVKRSYRSKWRVSFREYRDKHYPPYCPGWAIMYSPDVVFRLYREAQRERYFWIDDVLVTGILAARAGLVHTPIGDLVLTNDAVQNILDKNGTKPASTKFLYGPPDMKRSTIYALWSLVRDRASRVTKNDNYL